MISEQSQHPLLPHPDATSPTHHVGCVCARLCPQLGRYLCHLGTLSFGQHLLQDILRQAWFLFSSSLRFFPSVHKGSTESAEVRRKSW